MLRFDQIEKRIKLSRNFLSLSENIENVACSIVEIEWQVLLLSNKLTAFDFTHLKNMN